MRDLALIGCIALGACAGASQTLGAGRQPGAQRRASLALLPESPLATWTPLGPAPALPPPFGDIAALPHGAVIVIANGGLYRWQDGRATPVCDGFTPSPHALRADGDAFIAVSEGDAVVWASRDRGEHCTRTTLPSMYVPRGVSTTFGLALDGRTATVWSLDGAIAVSHDGGETFVRVADLPGVLAVARGAESRLVAVHLASTAPSLARNAYLPTTFADLAQPRAETWTPRWDLPTRRAPVELRRDDRGNLWMLDGLGLARITATGTFDGSPPEPLFRARQEQPRIIVPAGPGRFVATTEQTLLVANAEGGVHAFAALPTHDGRFALDASAEGDVWMATRDTLQRARIGSPAVDVVLEARTVPGNVRAMARDGLVVVIATSETHADDARAPFATAVRHSEDGGSTWSEATVRTTEPVVALAASRAGDTLVATGTADGATTVSYRLWAVDRAELIPVPLDPSARAGEFGQPPIVGILGHRWVVIDGEVRISEDQGRRWQSEPLPRVDARVIGAVIRPEGILILDATRHLWRSDETGHSFVPLGTFETPTGNLRGAGFAPRLAWDGGAHVVVVEPSFGLLRSFDGAQTWRDVVPARSLPPIDRVDVTSDGQLMLWTHDLQDFGCPAEGAGLVLMSSARTDLAPLQEICSHRALAHTLEGDRLTLVTPSGVIESADGSHLPRGSVRAMRARFFYR